MARRIYNSSIGATVTIHGTWFSSSTLTISKNGTEKVVHLPYDGEFPWAYDFDMSGNSNNFVVVYSGEFSLRAGKLISNKEPPTSSDINIGGANVAQFYSYDGQKIGDPIWLTSQTNQGHRPGIGVLNNGDYVAAWQTNNPLGYPELGDRILYVVGRYVKADGSFLGDTFVVAAGTFLLEEGVPPTVSEENGQIIIKWKSYTSQFGTEEVNGGDSGDISKHITGTDSNDTIISFEGNDIISGLGGEDEIDGGSGDDELSGGAGNDSIAGGNGTDTAVYADTSNAVTVNLATGIATGDGTDSLSGIENITGGGGNDSITGNASNNSLVGGQGDDFLYAGTGDDIVDGGVGNDLIVGGDGAGNDTYIGGNGNDTIKYTSARASITVNLKGGAAASTASGDVAGIGTDSLADIENIIAGNYDDILTGSASANDIRGEAGNDKLDGDAGNDRLAGGGGNDTIIGGSGSDTAVYTGNFNDYTISYDNRSGVYIIIDKTSGRDGADTNVGIEFFEFNNLKKAATDLASNSAPTIIGLAGITQLVAIGVPANLADFTITDADNDAVTVTLISTNGTINGLTDANAGLAGIQLIGTAASINTAIAGATFTATAAGAASIGISVTDGKVAAPTTATYSFIATSAPIDRTAPTLSRSAPADNATNVAVGANIVLTFSEAVQKGAGNIVISNGTDVRTIAVTDSQVTVSGNTVTINPTADLLGGGAYNVQMASGVFRDLAGNAYAGISNATTLNFTTAGSADRTAPTVRTFFPADASTNAAIETNIVLTFSEAVQKGTGAIELRTGSPTGALVETFDVATSSKLTFSGSTLTIDPTDFLAGNTSYFVTFAAGSVKDLAGNSYAGTTAYDFKTANVAGIFGTPVANTLTGTTAANTIYGLGGADIINGGRQADTLWGGSGRDTFVFTEGDSGQTSNFDRVMDLAKGVAGTGDLLDFRAALTIGGSGAAATSTQASINQTTGIASFASGSGTTLSDALVDIAGRFIAATDSVGEFAFLKVNNAGDYHLFISDGISGLTANDVLVLLVGVTEISSINLANGNLTITA